MKATILLLLLVCLNLSTHAARLFVDGEGYASIQEAINASENHDSVFVSSGVWIGDVNIDHPLHIIGRGSIQLNTKSQIIGQMTIFSGGSGSTISGFSISEITNGNFCIKIDNNTSDILISNCRLQNCNGQSSAAVVKAGSTSVIFHSCIMQNSYQGISVETPSEVRVDNSIFNSIHNCIDTGMGILSSILLMNCTIDACQNLTSTEQYSTTISNSLLIGPPNIVYCSTLSLRYNCIVSGIWNDCQNLGNLYTSTYPLISNPNEYYDPVVHNFNPIPGSPILNAGDPNMFDRDGSRVDVGCTGGLNPFNFSGIPEFPVTTWLIAPSQVYQGQSLPIQAEGVIGD